MMRISRTKRGLEASLVISLAVAIGCSSSSDDAPQGAGDPAQSSAADRKRDDSTGDATARPAASAGDESSRAKPSTARAGDARSGSGATSNGSSSDGASSDGASSGGARRGASPTGSDRGSDSADATSEVAVVPATDGGDTPAIVPSAWTEVLADVPFIVGYDAGLEAARTRSKPALFLVTTAWCEAGDELVREALGAPEVRALLDGFVCVLVDAENETLAARRLAGDGFPHVSVRSPEGDRLADLGGVPTAPRLEQALRRARGRS